MTRRDRARVLATIACSFAFACGRYGAKPSQRDGAAVASRSSATNTVVWHELVASDTEFAAAFYAEVMGWRVVPESSGRTTWIGDTGPVAGMSPLAAEDRANGVRPTWLLAIEVDDVDDVSIRARLSEGKVFAEPRDAPGIRYATLGDRAGLAVRVTHDLSPRAPLGRRVATEFWWDEISTPDALGTLRCYGSVFDWTVLSDRATGASGRYAVLGRDGVPVAGMFVDPALRAQGWISYVEVKDLDAALTRAVSRGATITLPVQVAPDGRVAQLRDPRGAFIGLHQSSKAGARD